MRYLHTFAELTLAVKLCMPAKQTREAYTRA
jgi:hypothetical protein